MKRIFILAIVGLAWNFAQAQELNEVQPPGAFIAFAENSKEFGDITQGDVVEHVFTFENTGDEPLIITTVNVTCGCTATEWPREPILPGVESSIKVKFNSAGKSGRQNKVITVVSNSVAPINQVKIVTNVLPKAN